MLVTILWYVFLVLYVPACIGLIAVVLLQKGKGVGFAGAFGAGPGSEAVFGPRSARSLPQKITYTMAGLFMALALVMSMLSGRVGRGAAPDLIPEEELQAASSIDALFDGEDTSLPTEEDAGSMDVTPVTVTDPAPAIESPEAPVMAPVEEAAPGAEAEAPAAETPEAPAPEAEAPAEAAPADESESNGAQ